MQTKFFIATIIIILNLFFAFPSACLSQEGKIKKSSIRIEDPAICQGVVNRTPVEQGDVFPGDVKKLFCFTRVVGAKEDTEVIHEWYYKGRIISRVFLPVKSVSWRTHSSKTILPEYTGEWKVEVMSKDGELLKQIYFAVH